MLAHSFSDQIIIKVAGNQDRHKSLDEFDFRPDQTTHLFSVAFDPILFILAGNEHMHKVSNEFEFRSDWTTD